MSGSNNADWIHFSGNSHAFHVFHNYHIFTVNDTAKYCNFLYSKLLVSGCQLVPVVCYSKLMFSVVSYSVCSIYIKIH